MIVDRKINWIKLDVSALTDKILYLGKVDRRARYAIFHASWDTLGGGVDASALLGVRARALFDESDTGIVMSIVSGGNVDSVEGDDRVELVTGAAGTAGAKPFWPVVRYFRRTIAPIIKVSFDVVQYNSGEVRISYELWE